MQRAVRARAVWSRGERIRRLGDVGDKAAALVVLVVKDFQHLLYRQVQRAVAPRKEDVDVAGHALTQARCGVGNLDLGVKGDDGAALLALAYRRDPAHPAAIGGVGIGIHDDVHILAGLHPANVDFRDVAAHDELAGVADLEKDRPAGIGRQPRGDHLADFHVAADDDAVNRREDPHLVKRDLVL